MKKRFCRASTVAGLLAGSLFVNAQSGGGGGAGGGGGGAGGGAGGAAGGGAAGGAAGVSGGAAGAGISGAPGGISGRAGGISGQSGAGINANAPGVGQPGASVGVNPRGGTINSIGAAGINQPSGSAPIGGASVIGTAPNTVGGSSITGQNPGAPAGQGTVGTLPGSGVLPPGSAARQAQPGDIGQPVFQNGTLQGGVAAGNSAANAAAANPAIANAQAGIPLTSLPANLQQTIQQRLGGAQVQTISRDDLANGSVYRVTTLQNGTPTELRFGANGAFLGSAALPGTATSFVTPAVGGVVLDTLPVPVQSTIRGQAGTGRINNIVPQGQGWVVTYDVNGQPTTMLVGPDGRIVRAGPTANTATGAAAPAATGGGAATNAPSNTTTNGQRTSSVNLDDLPDEVRSSLGQEIGAADVQFVRREQRPIGDVYVVGARTPDQYVQLTVDSSGKVIRDSRDVPMVTIGPVAPRRAESDQATGIPIYRVPVAVQDAVKAYATASDIRSVNLGQDQGRAVYDVVFMRGAHRDRMIVAKDGTLVRMERNVSPALDNSAAGARLAIGDLPAEVRETILQQTEQVLVKDVSTKRLGDQTVYSVRYETNGAPVELMVASDGTVVIPETSPDADVPNSPRPAPLDPDAPTPVRVVDNVAASVAPADGSLSAAGSAAATETSAAASATRTGESATEAASAEPAQKVTLTDVPLPVQTSATKLAGNAVIESINPTLGDNGIIYQVKISENGQTRTLHLNKDGAVRPGE